MNIPRTFILFPVFSFCSPLLFLSVLMTHLSPECFRHWVPKCLLHSNSPPFYFVQSPYFILFVFPLTLFPFHPSPPSLFFRVPCFLFPRTFKHVQVPPYFRSFTLFWVDQIYIHSIKMTRLFLLRKYEVQMQALGDGGN